MLQFSFLFALNPTGISNKERFISCAISKIAIVIDLPSYLPLLLIAVALIPTASRAQQTDAMNHQIETRLMLLKKRMPSKWAIQRCDRKVTQMLVVSVKFAVVNQVNLRHLDNCYPSFFQQNFNAFYKPIQIRTCAKTLAERHQQLVPLLLEVAWLNLD